MEATAQSSYGYAPLELAEFLHYRPRVFLFNSLREILKARTDETQPYEIRLLLQQFVAQLHGLDQVLLSLLEAFYGLSGQTSKSVTLSNKYLTPHVLKEAKLVAECLFYFFFCDAGSSTSSAVSEFLKRGLKQLLTLLDANFTMEETLLHEVTFTLVLTVHSLFVMTLGGSSVMPEDDLLTSAFLEQTDHTLASVLKNKELRGLLQLSFCVLVRRRGPAVCSVATEMSAANFARATEQEAFAVLATLLDHPSYGSSGDDGIEAYACVLDRLLSGLVVSFFPELAEFKRSEEEHLAYEKERTQRSTQKSNGSVVGRMQLGAMWDHQQRIQNQQQPLHQQQQQQQHQQHLDSDSNQDDRPKRFSQFMLLMQNAYRGQPVLAEKYWDFRGEKDPDNKSLHFFLGMAGRDGWQVRTPAGFCSYLNMLASFASGADNNCYYGYMFVKTGLNEFVRLSKFFDVLTLYASEVGKGIKLERAQEDVALAILRFVQAILGGSEEVRRLLIDRFLFYLFLFLFFYFSKTKSRERPLDVLKALLTTTVKPRIKAAVLDTLKGEVFFFFFI